MLQDARLSCFEYVEQLTLLLFLKMADQLTEEPYNRDLARLRKRHGGGRWRKLKGAALVRLASGRTRRAEVH